MLPLMTPRLRTPVSISNGGIGGTVAAALRGLSGDYVPVGNTSLTLPTTELNDTVNNSLNSRRICYAPAGGGLSDIVVGAPAFSLANPEGDFPVGYTLACSIEYPIGSTPRRSYWGGAASITVTPGRTLPLSDPVPVYIPAGAQFAIKSYVTWTAGAFHLGAFAASRLVGEWTTRGTGVADNTLNNTVLTSTTTTNGFAPAVMGRYAGPQIIAGLLGDSIGALTGDYQDGTGQLGWGRFIRNAFPWINLARGADSAAFFLARPDGRSHLLRRLTHVVLQMGSNDIFSGASLATLQANIQAILGAMLARGQRVYAVTITPRTTSTDGWLTAGNQTLVSPSQEVIRVAYNDWLRTNYRSLGFAGIFDIARGVDPTDSGKWGADAGGSSCINAALSFPTLSGGAVATVPMGLYNLLLSAGNAYQNNLSGLPCVTYPYPGTGGAGATATAATNGSGVVSAFTLTGGGAGYTYPPMISPASNWTGDGVHPNARGINEMLVRADFGPHRFLV